MNVVTRGVRDAFRNQIRTFSIIAILGLSVGLALAMLIARQAVTERITSVKASAGNSISISPAGVRGFDGGGDPLAAQDVAKLVNLAHVKAVDQSLSDRLTSENTTIVSAVDAGSLGKRFANNNGVSDTANNAAPTPPAGAGVGNTGTTRTFTPPVMLVGTTNPMDLSSAQGGGTFTLKSGKVFDASSSGNVALLGSTLATKNNLSVGSTFTAYGQAITVAAIFDSGNTFANNQVIMPLKAVQTLSSQEGVVTGATITADSAENVASVTTAASKILGTKADVTNSAAQAEATIAPLENIQTISLYSLIGAVGAGSVIILLTMIMIVRERRREIGVIKAIGASNLKVMFQFASEAVTLTVLASVVGVVIGVAAGSPITKMLVTNSTSTATGPGGMGGSMGAPGRGVQALGNNISNIQATVGWEIIAYGFGVAIVIAVVGSALASFFIAKIRPAEVMRAD